MQSFKKYIWLLPALYVAFAFGGKIVEVLADKQEFVDIISVIHPLAPFAGTLAYVTGSFDFLVALLLLTVPLFSKTKKFAPYLFMWTIFWPFIPSSIRYFGGVAPFEIAQVLAMSLCATLSYFLWYRYAKSS